MLTVVVCVYVLCGRLCILHTAYDMLIIVFTLCWIFVIGYSIVCCEY